MKRMKLFPLSDPKDEGAFVIHGLIFFNGGEHQTSSERFYFLHVQIHMAEMF